MKLRVVMTTIALGLAVVAGVSAQEESGFADDFSAYKLPKVTESMLLDGVRAGNSIVVVGEHGHIVVSPDEGATWTQAEVPTRSALTGVDFANGEIGFAVGHDAVILRTRDAGKNWERVYFDPEIQTPLLDVWVASETRAIAVGAYGLYLETNDGGDTWARRPFFSQPLPQPEAESDADQDKDADADADDEEEFEDDYVDPDLGEEFHFNHITAAGDGTLYIAGESGRQYRSDDQGTTWYRLRPPYRGSFFGTLPLDDGSFLALGMRGNVFRSGDRGVSYSAIDTGVNALLTAGFRNEAGRIVIVGLAGVVLESEDGGSSFSLRRQNDRSGSMMSLPISDGGLILIGESGVTRLDEATYRAGGQQ